MIASSDRGRRARSRRRSARRRGRAPGRRDARAPGSRSSGTGSRRRASAKARISTIELVLGADVDAARRIEQQQDAALGEQPFGDGDLLLVAAGEGADPGPQRPAVDLDAVEHARRPAAVSAAVSIRPTRREAVDDRQRGVVLAVELQEQRFGLAVLGHQADADIGAGSRRAARRSSPAGRRRGCRRA